MQKTNQERRSVVGDSKSWSRACDKDKKEKSIEASPELRNGQKNLTVGDLGYPSTARGLKMVDKLSVEAVHKHHPPLMILTYFVLSEKLTPTFTKSIMSQDKSSTFIIADFYNDPEKQLLPNLQVGKLRV